MLSSAKVWTGLDFLSLVHLPIFLFLSGRLRPAAVVLVRDLLLRVEVNDLEGRLLVRLRLLRVL